MNVRVGASALWSCLSADEKNYGIHPEKLSMLEFNLSEDISSSASPTHQLDRFFMGCRAATSDDNFRAISTRFLNSSEASLQPIKAVVERVLSVQIPKEITIQKSRNGSYPIPIEEDEFKDALNEYQAKFADIYNRLIRENRAYLMHPAQSANLIAHLQSTFSEGDRTAERLIVFRCFGQEALKISELKRAYDQDRNKLEQMEKELKILIESGPRYITKLESIQTDSFSSIADVDCRKYVCLAYKKLAAENKLEILNLSENELYTYEGGRDGKVHGDLASVEKSYYSLTSINYNFSVVVKYLKMLRKGDLNLLQRICLKEEIDRLKSIIKSKQHNIAAAEENHQKKLALLKKKSEDYMPGDFSFLVDWRTTRLLTNAYRAVERLNQWPFFDHEPPKDEGYTYWSNSTLQLIENELESDGHSSESFASVMRAMQDIRKTGWSNVVGKNLTKNAEQLGLLYRT